MDRSQYLVQALNGLQQAPQINTGSQMSPFAMQQLAQRAQAYQQANPGGSFIGHDLMRAGRNLAALPGNVAGTASKGGAPSQPPVPQPQIPQPQIPQPSPLQPQNVQAVAPAAPMGPPNAFAPAAYTDRAIPLPPGAAQPMPKGQPAPPVMGSAPPIPPVGLAVPAMPVQSAAPPLQPQGLPYQTRLGAGRMARIPFQ